jgi:hypothetical protein
VAPDNSHFVIAKVVVVHSNYAVEAWDVLAIRFAVALTLVFVVSIVPRVVVLVMLHSLKLVKEFLFILHFHRVTALVVFISPVAKGTSKGSWLVVIWVTELGKLAHAIPVDVLTVWHAILFILITLSLVLRLLLVVFVVVTSLIQ